MAQMNQKNPNIKTILVGMTGRIDSTVAAYLLKKQGHNVIGIGILFNKTDEVPSLDPKTGEAIKPYGVQFINDLGRVKGVCDELDIPFYGVHAEDRYRAGVEEFLVAARLGGTTYSPLVYSTRTILEILVEKMVPLKADAVATGNYAKVSINQSTGAIGLGQSNDLANDETFQMARIKPSDARHLILPLSEMRRKEVLKIYSSLNLKNSVSDKEIKGDKVNEILLMEDPRIIKVVEELSSEDLRRTGSLINYVEDSILGDHDGIHKYFIGQNKVKGKGLAAVDPKMQVVKIDPQLGDVYLAAPTELKFTFCELKDFSAGKDKNSSVPVEAHVKFRPDTLKVPCDVYLGNNDSAILEFKEAQKGQIVPGQFVVIYDREGEGAKVIGAGVVNRSGYFSDTGERRELPLTNSEKYDVDENSVKNKNTSPFKF